jgi:hypothetical protein
MGDAKHKREALQSLVNGTLPVRIKPTRAHLEALIESWNEQMDRVPDTNPHVKAFMTEIMPAYLRAIHARAFENDATVGYLLDCQLVMMVNFTINLIGMLPPDYRLDVLDQLMSRFYRNIHAIASKQKGDFDLTKITPPPVS